MPVHRAAAVAIGTLALASSVSAVHYEDPSKGCSSGEMKVEVQGLQGGFCSPACQGASQTCPTDTPGGSAKPQCALQTPAGAKYCALVCTPGTAGQCPSGAKCEKPQSAPIGLCMYADGKLVEASTTTLDLEAIALEKEFEKFVQKYEKTYATDELRATRFAVFRENWALVEAHNSAKKSFTMAINEFADLRSDEMGSRAKGYTGRPALAEQWSNLAYLGQHKWNGVQLPTSVDWTEHEAVTPVKNQGQCGSCWSFSTTGSLEGAMAIKTGKLVSLSEQQFVDCDTAGGDHGCSGGLMDNAFRYAESHDLCSEASYKYKAMGGKCKASSCKVAVKKGTVVGFHDVTPDSEKDLMSAIAKGPVSIAIEADQPSFKMYSGGVLTASCGTQLDHGVLVVGYGTLDGKDYWKVKNSWGASWGMDGYVLLERSANSDECGILKDPSFPEVSPEQKQAQSIVV